MSFSPCSFDSEFSEYCTKIGFEPKRSKKIRNSKNFKDTFHNKFLAYINHHDNGDD